MALNAIARDDRIADVFSDIPAFAQWRRRPLPRQLRQMLVELDEQTLMSLAAQCLRLVHETSEKSVERTSPPLF